DQAQPGQRGQDLVIHPNIASMTEGQNTQFIRLCLHHFMRAPLPVFGAKHRYPANLTNLSF
ncbi:MAG: hypothetical protein ACLQNE_08965, partial [Thermoguttaceae bacterium]